MYMTDRYHQISKFQGNSGYLEQNEVIFRSIETKWYSRILIQLDRFQTFCKSPKLYTVSYTHLTLPTISLVCRSRWSPYH